MNSNEHTSSTSGVVEPHSTPRDSTVDGNTSTFTTTDASGYPDKHDGLSAHSTQSVTQSPHEHHKHNQVHNNRSHIHPPGELVEHETMVGKPLTEVAEQLGETTLAHSTLVPNHFK
ncbi:hypothetical protein BGZ98_009183 [Dissophora globulifera]|nr:hypothetical protein BGZ98_009183 [Dissophora globulifera]